MAPDLRCPAQPRNDGFSRSRSEAAILLPFSLAENGSSVSRHGYPEPDRQLTTKPGHRREHALPVCVTKRAILPVLCRTPVPRKLALNAGPHHHDTMTETPPGDHADTNQGALAWLEVVESEIRDEIVRNHQSRQLRHQKHPLDDAPELTE
jgi:hypothetical protein